MPVPWLFLALPWCICCGVIACVPLKRKLIRPVLWGAMCAVAWMGLFVILLRIFNGQVVGGLAQTAVDWVAASPDGNTILLNAYSMGLARLEGTEALAVRFLSVLTADTRMQLLWSLRVSLEETLPQMLCDAVVYHTALTVLLCVLFPDWRRRKSGVKGELPTMDRWYIPRGYGLGICCLAAGWLFAYMSDGGIDMYFGLLCVGVFKTAFLLQGVCFLIWMEKRAGIRSMMRNIWAIVLSLLAPIVPIFMGLIDQRRDTRHLRPDKEVESL